MTGPPHRTPGPSARREHTHGGRVRLPWFGTPFAPVADKRYVEGLHRWENRWLHITRGVGNLHGVRLNCRPEISVLDVL